MSSLVEKLAIEHGSTCYTGQEYHFERWQLEAFAKALQSSEPVAKVIHTKGTGLLEGKTITKVMLDINHVDLPAGTELFTHPPASVPLEKYNKLLDALKDADEMIGIEPFEHVAQEAADAHRNIRALIAEAEGKEG